MKLRVDEAPPPFGLVMEKRGCLDARDLSTLWGISDPAPHKPQTPQTPTLLLTAWICQAFLKPKAEMASHNRLRQSAAMTNGGAH